MAKDHVLRDCAVAVLLLLGAVYANWLGMGPAAMTFGRFLGMAGYLLLSMALIIWSIYCILKGSIKKRASFAAVGLLALFLLLVWPFTSVHGRLDDCIYRSGREDVIEQWRAGEASPVGLQNYWVGANSWDRRMYVTDGMFIFTAYNGFFRRQDILYSSQAPSGRWSGAVSLGNGWYCCTLTYG